MAFDLRHEALDRALLDRHVRTRRDKLIRKMRRADREIEARGADRQRDQRDQRDRAAAPQLPFGAASKPPRALRGRKQPARHLDARGLGFRRADQADAWSRSISSS